jgi:iron complex outermembrane receptor protein
VSSLRLLVIIVLFSYTQFAFSHEGDTYRVYGTIYYGGVALQNATISIEELKMTKRTDINGYFSFDEVPDGVYTLFVYRGNTSFLEKSIRVLGEDVHVDVDLDLATVNIQAQTVEANPFRNGAIEKSLGSLLIQRAQLDRYAAESFMAVLENEPGISMINTGVGISKPVIRGMAFNRVMVNDRGVKQEGQQWGADHGLEIDPFDVENVEVIKGPASLMYGSDAMGGVINIKPPMVLPAGERRGGVRTLYRSNNDLYALSGFVEGSEGKWFYRARITGMEYGNYRVPADDFVYAGFVLPIYDQMLTNTAGRERHFSSTIGYKLNSGYSSITVSRFFQEVGLFPGAVGLPRAYNLQHRGEFRNVDLPSQENTHLKVLSNTNVKVGASRLELDFGYQRNLRRELSFPHAHGMSPRPEGNLAMELDLHTFTGNLRLTREYGLRTKLIIGSQNQIMNHEYDGFEFLVPSYRSFLGGVYGLVEYAVRDNLFLNLGVRGDVGWHDIDQHLQPIYNNFQPTGEFSERNPATERTFGNWSAATGLSWVLNNELNVKLNLGSSFRIPTPVELSINGVHHGNFRHELGNPDLQSERGFQGDLNIVWRKKSTILSLTPFASIYDSYIYLAPSGRFSNLPGSRPFWEYRQNAAVFTGIEWKMETVLWKFLHVENSLEYVWNRNLDTRLPLPLTPPLAIFSSIGYERESSMKWLSSWYIRVDMRNVSSQERVDRNELSTEGFTIFGAGVGASMLIGKQSVELQIRGTNIGDTFYMHHLSRYRLLNLPEQGRNVSILLHLPLG